MTVKLRSSGWEFGGKHLPWAWGQINYWDLDRSRWRDVLRAYRELGHTVVSTAVLPRVHQGSNGHYDFANPQPQNDLGAFLNEIQQCGLKAVLWVGPRDIPGIAAAGYPEDLLCDKTALALNAADAFIPSSPTLGGDVFPLPCLVGEPLQHSLTAFARALQPVLTPLIHPDGPIIGMGLTQAPGWSQALAPTAADYHPTALGLYHAFLKKNYKKLQAVIETYGQVVGSFESLEPPRRIETAGDQFPQARFLDWARFREEYFVQAAERLYTIFSPLALDRIPLFLASIPVNGYPSNLTELERSRCFAYTMPDLPLTVSHSDAIVDFLAPILWQTRFPAWFQARPESQAEETEKNYALGCGVAAGLRAWDAITPAGSGSLPGFLMDRQGTPHRRFQHFWDTVREHAKIEGFLNSQLFADVLLITIPDFERAKYLETPAIPRYDLAGITSLGFETKPAWDRATQNYASTQKNLEQFLNAEHYAYLNAEGSKNAFDRINLNQVLLIPSQENMPAGLQALLADMLEKGNHVVLIGPLPKHPENAGHVSLEELADMKPKPKPKTSHRSKNMKTGKLYHLPEFSDQKLARTLKQAGIVRELTVEHPGLKLTVHKFRNRIFIALINPAQQPVETIAHREGKFVLKDFWNTKKYFGGNHEIRLTLPARSVKFWELIPC